MCGSTGSPVLDLIVGFFSFLGDPIGTVINLIAKTILAGAVAVFAALATAVPTLAGTQQSKDISDKTQWIVVYLAVGSLLFASAKMAFERRGTAGVTALKGILRVAFVSGAATTIVVAAAKVADAYSDYLFDDAVKNSLQNVGACTGDQGMQSFVLLVLAFLLLIAGILHTILMYIRLGVVMIMLGTLPLAAAASMTDWGAGWWRKHIGWLIAWLLYKPAVALILSAGTAMLNAGNDPNNSADSNNINTRIAGIGVMLLSAIALPALLKLIVPAAAAMGAGNPMSSAGQATGNFASGAVQLSALGGAGGGSDPGGQVGPRGASGSNGASGSGGSSGSGGASGQGGAPGSSGSNGQHGAGAGGGASGAGKAAGGSEAAAAMAGPAGIAILGAVALAQTAGSTVSGAVEGADGDEGNNK
ncbi:hypothetical protein ACIRPX_13625 [Streptomyces sp. NPDC101225]|uniref:hypothetical protein n=1 Tax=Streptomyces sp. NPDC101225 TaxID=3366135 RepID=UPI0038260AD8